MKTNSNLALSERDGRKALSLFSSNELVCAVKEEIGQPLIFFQKYYQKKNISEPMASRFSKRRILTVMILKLFLSRTDLESLLAHFTCHIYPLAVWKQQ